MNIEEVIQWLEEYILEEYGECLEALIINCVVARKSQAFKTYTMSCIIIQRELRQIR